MISIRRYSIKNPHLLPYVKWIWHCESGEENIYYKLLPTDCIDIIMNLSKKMFYETDSINILAAPVHINGLRSKYSYIRQEAPVHIWGVSFYYFGLYPFIHQSLESIRDTIVDLYDLSYLLAGKLELAVTRDNKNERIRRNIEDILYEELKIKNTYAEKLQMIWDFFNTNNNTTVQEFCLNNQIRNKTFTRNVLSYTGYTPKVLYAIMRFQKVGNQLIYQEKNKFSQMEYLNSFSDQSHFIREFKRFSGVSPSVFMKERITVKENAKYFYE